MSCCCCWWVHEWRWGRRHLWFHTFSRCWWKIHLYWSSLLLILLLFFKLYCIYCLLNNGFLCCLFLLLFLFFHLFFQGLNFLLLGYDLWGHSGCSLLCWFFDSRCIYERSWCRVECLLLLLSLFVDVKSLLYSIIFFHSWPNITWWRYERRWWSLLFLSLSVSDSFQSSFDNVTLCCLSSWWSYNSWFLNMNGIWSSDYLLFHRLDLLLNRWCWFRCSFCLLLFSLSTFSTFFLLFCSFLMFFNKLPLSSFDIIHVVKLCFFLILRGELFYSFIQIIIIFLLFSFRLIGFMCFLRMLDWISFNWCCLWTRTW
jgi:hypothetical protein